MFASIASDIMFVFPWPLSGDRFLLARHFNGQEAYGVAGGPLPRFVYE